MRRRFGFSVMMLAALFALAGLAKLVARGRGDRVPRPSSEVGGRAQPTAAPARSPGPGDREPAHAAAPNPAPLPAPQLAADAVRRAPAAGSEPALTNEQILAHLKAGDPGFEILASRLPVERATVKPAWQAGDEWIVDTFYRQMQAPNEPWTGPARWRFRIEREVSFRDAPCLEFVVSRADDAAVPPAVFYVTREGYRLAGAETTVTQQGKSRRVTVLMDSAAARAPLSIVPFDLPPLGAEGAEARVAPPGLAFDREPPGGLAASDRARLPAASAIIGAGEGALDLEYENPRDRTRVRQRWSPADMRWPVISRTETTWSFRRRS